MKLRGGLSISSDGHLKIGGCDTKELAKEFGTPLYVFDEGAICAVAKEVKATLDKKYPNNVVAYASKAFSCLGIYQIMKELGFAADVASGGELYTALKAKFDPKKIYFHGNNKTASELAMAVQAGIHSVVIDSHHEIELLNTIAGELDKKQGVLVRVNPGVEAHTHHYIQTAMPDSKFGFAIDGGTATEAIKLVTASPNLEFLGLHCHIGSQIFETAPFELAVDTMTDYIVQLAKEENIIIKELNVGGGWGIIYTDEDTPLPAYQYAEAIADKLKNCVSSKKITAPRLVVEPGRSLVGEAGITLYTIGSIKDIKGVKKYLAVDGGMFDNPRYALYQSKYDAALVTRADEKPTETVSIAGKCCESGDIVIGEVKLPKAQSGEVLAVLSTGAYNYSMASNYNRNAIPPVVLIKDGKAEYLVKPQSYKNILSRDVVLKRGKK